MNGLDPVLLKELVDTRMPFGKYQGRVLADVPEDYLLWFSQKGFPPGRLGQQLALLLVIKSEGLEPLLAPLRGASQRR